MMEIFWFAAFEALHPARTWTIQFLMISALSAGCFVANYRLSARQVLAGSLTALFIAVAVVFINKAGPKATLLLVFGMHLPVLTFFTLVLPIGFLVLLASEKFQQRTIIPFPILAVFLLFGASTNIELLNNISTSYSRADDYATQLQAGLYFSGHLFSNMLLLVMPALIVGALAHGLPRLFSGVLFWLLWLCLSGLTVWMNYEFLGRIVYSLRTLYF